MTTFAETVVLYPDGQYNVADLPASLMNNGFIPKQIGVRGQPLPAQYLNWLFREAFRQINLDRTVNGNGVGAMDSGAEGLVTLYAIDTVTPANYIHAVGHKAAAGAPVFTVIGSNTLGLGTLTDTDVPITGGLAADVLVRVSVRA